MTRAWPMTLAMMCGCLHDIEPANESGGLSIDTSPPDVTPLDSEPEPEPKPYDGPALFDVEEWSDALTHDQAPCSWRVWAEFMGTASRGVLDLFETRTTRDYSEQHVLLMQDPIIEIELQTDALVGEQQPGLNTAFRCGELPSSAAASVVTLALRLYDANDQVTDCIIWGDDPDLVLDGTVSGSDPNTTPPRFEVPQDVLTACHIVDD